MKKYEIEAFLKSFLIFFLFLSLFGAIIMFYYYNEKVHIIQDNLKREMLIFNYNFENPKFDIDFVDKKASAKIGKLYIDKDLYMFFPIPKVENQLLKIIYPKSEYEKEIEKIKREVFIKYSFFVFIILVFSIFYAFYSIYPLRYAVNLLDEFLKDIIHDLNTPLSAIVLNIKMLKRKINSPEIERLEISAKTLENLYKNLNFFIKRNRFPKEEIEIGEIVKERVDFFKILYPHINFSLNLKPMRCYCSKEAFVRILDNIISNACKYNKYPYLIDIKLKDNTLIIEDSGTGIKNPSKIFQRYYKEEDRGLGIGLHIVKKLCETLKIDIAIESFKDKGTKVILKFKKSLL